MLLFSIRPWAVEFVAGRVTLNAPVGGSSTPIFTSVNFRQAYTTPPLVFVVNSNQASSESNVRIRNVTTTGFEIAHVFPDNSVSTYPDLDIDYIAMEEGVHTLAGNTLVVGFVDTAQFQSRLLAGDSWDSVDFVADHGVTFSGAPSVITQIQTMANETTPDLSTPSSPFMDVAVRSVTTASMDIAIERAETTTGTPPALVSERIAYLAMASGDTGTFNDSGGTLIRYQALQSADNITGNCTNVGIAGFTAVPLAFASLNRRDGADGSWARVCSKTNTNIAVKVQEDIATDTNDVAHTDEVVGLLAISEAFDLNGAFQAEAGSLSITGTTAGSVGFTSVSFATAFDAMPRVFTVPVNEEDEPVALRLKNISTNGFEIAQVQPTRETGGAESMTVDYIAAIDGLHFLNDSTPLEVGSIATTATQFSAPVTGTQAWDTINFNHDFGVGNDPVVLLEIQTVANEPALDPSSVSVPWLGTTSQAVTPTSIDVALERAESAAGSVSAAEEIAYLAVQPNTTGSFQVGFNSIDFESQRVNAIEGTDNGCFSRNFLGSYSAAPIAVASQYLRNGANGGWVKRCAISNAAIGLQIDEDRSNDAERGHIAEEAHIFALSEVFAGDFPEPELMILKNANGATTANSGATVIYNLTVSNAGANGAFNVILNDDMPGFSGLVLDAYGAGMPFSFAPGASTLTLGTPVYSQDNGLDGFAHTVAATGVDNTITDWRIPLTGTMPSGTSFTLQYQIEID